MSTCGFSRERAVAVEERPAKVRRSCTPLIDRAHIYAVIPARAGSKGVKGKNIKTFCGKPLMAWAIENGLRSKYISRTFVSTDSEAYRQVALQHGAEVPFLRPPEISHDTATDHQLFKHFLEWMQEHEQQQPSLLVQLRPTAPCVTAELVDACIEKFLAHEDNDYDSLRTVTPNNHEPFNMYFMSTEDNELLAPLLPRSHHKDDPSHMIVEPQSVARQILPQIYWHNAYVDIFRPETVLELGSCMGKRCLAFHMSVEDTADIDTPEQWAAAEAKKHKQLQALAQAAVGQ